MGEAILVKAGGLGGSNGSDPEDQNIVDWQLKTELITNTKEYLVPKARNQEFTVMLFGGGGGASTMTNRITLQGGYGNMNKGVLILKRGDSINVVIGSNGRANEAGGTTTFGTYLSATGGGVADYPNNRQAEGGIGLGAIAIGNYTQRSDYSSYYEQDVTHYYWENPREWYNATNGTYGGGGGGISIIFSNGYIINCKGGSGGIYGGGGGTYAGDSIKTGGNGCGNGGNGTTNATNGTNTIGKIIGDYNSYGERGYYNRGTWTGSTWSYKNEYGFCGGGGYGGNGGGGYNGTLCSHYSSIDGATTYLNGTVCGGGGGYGYQGATGGVSTRNVTQTINASSLKIWSGNYIAAGGDGGGYGGMGYGPSGYSAGGKYAGVMGDSTYSDSKNGIAVITYYAPVYNNG